MESTGSAEENHRLQLNEWNHIAATFDTGHVKLYLDGTFITEKITDIKYSSLIEYKTDDIYIGQFHSQYERYKFNGALDEIRIYNSVLSEEEIYDLYKQTNIVNVSGSETQTPEIFQVKQNFPNPFNPKTTIEYSVLQDSHIILTIYNVYGQSVSVLKDDYQKAGNYSVTWNASGMPNGLYFCTLREMASLRRGRWCW